VITAFTSTDQNSPKRVREALSYGGP